MVPPADGTAAGPEVAVERLRRLLRFRTVSTSDPAVAHGASDPAEFDALLAALPGTYPRAHEVLQREVIAGRTALYRWPGRTAGDPAVLMAHYDVVPAGEEGWTHPPFAGAVTGEGADRTVWGRGAMDMKGVVGAVLEAVDRLAAAGHRPRHDLYLSFGHDEEVGGSGACAVAAALGERGIRPRFVLDEGGAVVRDVLPGVEARLAVVGVAEKGTATVRLRVVEEGGHAATPPRVTAAVRLARAVARLGRHPQPARLDPVLRQLLRTVAPHSRAPHRWVYAHLRLTALPLTWALGRISGTTSALVRTTQAVTQLGGGVAANVLPAEVQAVLDLRVAPGTTVAAAVERVRRVVGDPEVAVEVLHSSEPSPVSPASGDAWELLTTTIAQVFPDALAVPYVMLQASDSRHFADVSDHVYRFAPFDMSTAERAALHGRDERIRVDTYLGAVAFFEALVRRL